MVYTIVKDRIDNELYIFNDDGVKVQGPFDSYAEACDALAELCVNDAQPTLERLENDFGSPLPRQPSRFRHRRR